MYKPSTLREAVIFKISPVTTQLAFSFYSPIFILILLCQLTFFCILISFTLLRWLTTDSREKSDFSFYNLEPLSERGEEESEFKEQEVPLSKELPLMSTPGSLWLCQVKKNICQ